MLDYSLIKRCAAAAGFDLCGIARCRKMSDEQHFLEQWLSEGKGSTLDYLARNIHKRGDTSLLVEGAKSVIVCAIATANVTAHHYTDGTPKVAAYAISEDYHTAIKRMLGRLYASLREHYPTLQGRTFCDTAPLFEKQYAADAGLGWIGRQSLLVTPQYGTCVLLGELVVTDECERYDAPLASRCGTCRRCIDACPNHAIIDHHIDTRLCISRATIEREGEPLPLHGWVFGCDECQRCCPHNQQTAHSGTLTPLFNPCDITRGEWLDMSDKEFEAQLGTTPLTRSGLERIKRNITKD